MNHHIRLAKSAIFEYLKDGKAIDVPADLPPEFYAQKGGVFVSIHKGKELRGCIGTFFPAHENLAKEIIMNAIAAGSQDFRFLPLSGDELDDISLEVSLLSEPQRVSNLKMLDPQKYGIIVKCPDGRCGLLLPGLEGLDEIQDQLSIACQKGGISPSRDSDMELYRFEVEKYSD